MIRQVLFTSEQLKKNKMAFIGIFLQINNLVFGLLVIQFVWYILKQIIHLSVGKSGGYLLAGYLLARQIFTTIHLHFGE